MRHGAVVVGGTGAVGQQVVRRLVALGVPVAFTYFRREEAAESLLAETAGPGGPSVSALALDLARPAAAERLLEHAVRAIPDFDVLVDCAGRNIRQQMNDVTVEDWNSVQAVNLFGVFSLCRVLGRHMADQGRGAIVTMSSTAAVRPLKRSPHYIAAKAGVLGLTQFFAASLAPQVIVNAVMPGLIASRARPDDQEFDSMLQRVPLGRLGDIESVARAILFLSEPDAYITGQLITVDGGLTL